MRPTIDAEVASRLEVVGLQRSARSAPESAE